MYTKKTGSATVDPVLVGHDDSLKSLLNIVKLWPVSKQFELCLLHDWFRSCWYIYMTISYYMYTRPLQYMLICVKDSSCTYWKHLKYCSVRYVFSCLILSESNISASLHSSWKVMENYSKIYSNSVSPYILGAKWTDVSASYNDLTKYEHAIYI